jgi:hypothetical protein
LWLWAGKSQDRGPDQWSRLKLEYELKCYREAEKVARARMRLLQAAASCEASPTR